MPEDARVRVRAQFDMSIRHDFETLDRIYDVVETCGFSIDHLEVLRAGEASRCHLVVEGWSGGLSWLDDSMRGVLGVTLGDTERPCPRCLGAANRSP
ncbi:MAG: hypothetical protein ACYDGR_10750 [Candidatus Dormibacteria bacterium]